MQAPEIVVRVARDDELDEVSALIDIAYAQYDAFVEGASPERIASYEAYRIDRRDVQSRLHDSELLVAEVDERVVGTVTFYPPRPDERTGEGWPEGWASIRLLAVHPSARGLGVGRRLTQISVEQARALGAPVLGLHTTVLMEVAKAMYERMGFVRAPEFDFWPSPDFVVEGYRLDL
jgi:predicted N-acetyltransferase YhbS